MRLNADGFGIGWYGKRGAAIYRSVVPAWNNRNLRELCGSVESRCIFAHVRAATPTPVVSEENCHPFRYGPLLFQHNGHVEGFSKIKRRIMNALPEDLYNFVEGTTDSEACFALLLSLLDRDTLASGRVPPAEMQSATLGTIALLRDFLESEQIDTGYSTFNFALTDGHSVVVTRFCDKAPKIPPPSLYYAFLPEDALRSHLGDDESFSGPRGPAYGMSTSASPHTRAAKDEAVRTANVSRKGAEEWDESCDRGAFVCASEPLTKSHEHIWHLIEENSMICFSLDDPQSPSLTPSQPSIGRQGSRLEGGPVEELSLSRRSSRAPSLTTSPKAERGPTPTFVGDAGTWSKEWRIGVGGTEPTPIVGGPTPMALPPSAVSKTDSEVAKSNPQPVEISDDSAVSTPDRVSVTALGPDDLTMFVTKAVEVDTPSWRRRFVLNALGNGGSPLVPASMSAPVRRPSKTEAPEKGFCLGKDDDA